MSSGTSPIPRSCIAVDWSGAMQGASRRMWLAEACAGRLERLERGRDRAQLVTHLIACAAREPRLVVGFDFAFSFPSWFLEARGLASARELWEHVARHGERWLARSPAPFWGKPGVRRSTPRAARSPWRVTESEVPRVHGIGPKSVFQTGGAGSVGTGSLRGMPWLARLQDAGFAIWPFDEPRLPMVVEIYPRDFTGPVNKSSAVARALQVQARLAHEPRELQDLVASTEDAFDAALSAQEMSTHQGQFSRLAQHAHAVHALEGRIWRPIVDPIFTHAPVDAYRDQSEESRTLVDRPEPSTTAPRRAQAAGASRVPTTPPGPMS